MLFRSTTVLLLAPLGVCLGMFMPLGLGVVAGLGPHADEYVAWGWAVNGFFSVIGSVGTTILAMAYGFRTVQVVALCVYGVAVLAFLALERVRRLIEKYNLSFDEARQQAAASHIFTTHTPVPAGIDRFPPDMIARYFRNYHPQLRLDLEGLLALGRENVMNRGEFFSMAVLAIRTADTCNGVSKLHGEVSRSMWQSIWPSVPQDEVPITHVTNGVHAQIGRAHV